MAMAYHFNTLRKRNDTAVKKTVHRKDYERSFTGLARILVDWIINFRLENTYYNSKNCKEDTRAAYVTILSEDPGHLPKNQSMTYFRYFSSRCHGHMRMYS